MMWTPNGVPGSNDTATITGGAPTDSTTVISGATGSVNGLTISGNAALADSTLAIPASGTFMWNSDGQITNSKINLATGATMTISGNVEIDGGEIDNHGAIVWLTGTLAGESAAILRNFGTLVASPGTSLGYGSGLDTADIYNTGTFTFTGPGTLSDEAGFWGFHNSGDLVITSGAIELHDPGNTTNSLEDGNHISGGGTLRLISKTAAASLTFNGTTTIDSGATLELASGSQSIGKGTLAGPGTLVWSGGGIGAGTPAAPLVWASGLVVKMTGTDVKDLYVGHVENDTTVTWDGGALGGAGGTQLINVGTFLMAGDLSINYSPSGGNNTATFHNEGTFIKSAGTGTGIIESWALVNDGLVNVASGKLELHSADNLEHHFNDDSKIQGWVRLVGVPGSPALVNLAGTTNLLGDATLELSTASELTSTGTISGTGKTIVDGGEILADDKQTVTFAHDSTLELAANASGNVIDVSDSGTLVFAGTTTWTGGALELSNGKLTNTGTFTIKTPAELTINTSSATFVNQGTLASDPGSGTVVLDPPVQNSGSVELDSGTTVFAGYSSAYVQTAGTLALAGGNAAAYIETGDSTAPHEARTIALRGGRLEGAGSIDAMVVNNGATVAPGGTGKAGAFTIAQTYTQSATGILETELGGKNDDELDSLQVSGQVTLNGTIAVRLLGSYLPSVGDTFQVIASTGAGGAALPSGDTGKFSTVTQAQNATVQVTYDPADVTLGVTQVDTTPGGPDGGTGPVGGSGSSGGCAFAAPGSGAPVGGALALIGLALAFAVTRRRCKR